MSDQRDAAAPVPGGAPAGGDAAGPAAGQPVAASAAVTPDPVGPAGDGSTGAGDGAGAEPSGAEAGPGPSALSVEALLDDVERLTRERDDYLDRWQRSRAEFENAKKRLQRDADDRADAVAARLVDDLLPVLDACDSAIGHGAVDVEPVFAALLQTLEKSGLERIDPAGDVFDPTRHEAVLHEPAGPDDDPALAVVSEVLRIGYAWKGRVARPAMVKVRG